MPTIQMTKSHLFLAHTAKGDPKSVDYRLNWGQDGLGIPIGYVIDVALIHKRESGSMGYDLFDFSMDYLGYKAPGEISFEGRKFIIN